MSAAVFSIRASIVMLRSADPLVDAGGHRFAHAEQLIGARAVAGDGDLDIVEHAGRVEQPAEADQRRIGRVEFACAADFVERRRRRRARRQLERDQQRDRRSVRES